MPKNSPLALWLVFIALGLLIVAWLILQAGPTSPWYPYALFVGGMASGMLIMLGLTTRRWAKGQRAFAKRSGGEASDKSRAARSATCWGCAGHVLGLLWLLLGLVAGAYLLVTLR